MKKFVALFAVVLLTVSLTACSTGTQLDRDDVASVIILYNGAQHYFFTEEDADACIGLYNQSETVEAEDNADGSPQYQVTISLKNGSSVTMDELPDSENDLIARRRNKNAKTTAVYYVNNDELVMFIEDLIQAKFSAE